MDFSDFDFNNPYLDYENNDFLLSTIGVSGTQSMTNQYQQPPTDFSSSGLLNPTGGLFEGQMNCVTDEVPEVRNPRPQMNLTSSLFDDDFLGCGLSQPSVYDSSTDKLQTNMHGYPTHESQPSVYSLPTDNVDKAGDTIVDEVVKKQEATTNNNKAEDQPVIDIEIHNVVCTFSTECKLNLKKIGREGMNVEYKECRRMVSMKLRKPSVTASIWAKGKIACTGSRSEEDARVAARKVARCLQRIGIAVKFRKFRIVNVLGTCSLPWGIRLPEFSRKYPKLASYEPELHPGVTYKISLLKATLKIFSTGNITVTAPSVNNVQRAIEHIYPLVHDFRRENGLGKDVVGPQPPKVQQSKQRYPSSLKRALASESNQIVEPKSNNVEPAIKYAYPFVHDFRRENGTGKDVVGPLQPPKVQQSEHRCPSSLKRPLASESDQIVKRGRFLVYGPMLIWNNKSQTLTRGYQILQ